MLPTGFASLGVLLGARNWTVDGLGASNNTVFSCPPGMLLSGESGSSLQGGGWLVDLQFYCSQPAGK